MTGEIDVEDVFPVFLLGRTRFNFRHINLKGIEGLEGVDERARLISNGKEDRGAIIAGRRTSFLRDHEEARRVSGAILNGGSTSRGGNFY